MYQYVEDGRGVLNVYYCILVYMVNVRISHLYHKYSSILYGRGLIDIKRNIMSDFVEFWVWSFKNCNFL